MKAPRAWPSHRANTPRWALMVLTQSHHVGMVVFGMYSAVVNRAILQFAARRRLISLLSTFSAMRAEKTHGFQQRV